MLLGLITPAFAQAANAGSAQSIAVNLLPIAGVFLVMYFFMIRPQQKRMKEHQNMLSNLRRGDHVVALSGVVGVITKIVDDREVDISSGSAELRILKSSINQVLDKGVEEKEDKKSKMKVVSNIKKK